MTDSDLYAPETSDELVERIRGSDDPAELAGAIREAMDEKGRFRPGRADVARAIARWAPTLDAGVVAAARGNAGLLPYLIANPALGEADADELVEAALGAIEHAPTTLHARPDHMRAMVAQAAARAVDAYVASGRDGIEVDALVDRLAGAHASAVADESRDPESPRLVASMAARLRLAARGEGEDLEALFDTIDAADHPAPLRVAALDVEALPLSRKRQLIERHPDEAVLLQAAKHPDLATDEAIAEVVLAHGSTEALVALGGQLEGDRIGDVFSALLRRDPRAAAKVFEAEEVREQIDDAVLAEAMDGLAEHAPDAALHMLRRDPDRVTPHLSDEAYVALFGRLVDEAPTAALAMLRVSTDRASAVLTARELRGLFTSGYSNVRTAAALLGRQLDIELEEGWTDVEHLLTKQALVDWIADQSGRAEGHAVIEDYLAEAERITGGRQAEGDRFHQTVTSAAMATYRPGPAFVEMFAGRWPWALRDLADNRSLPDETREALATWADEHLAPLEALAEVEEAGDRALEDATRAVAVLRRVTATDDEDALQALVDRLVALLGRGADSDREPIGELRGQAFRELMALRPPIDRQALGRLYDLVGTELAAAAERLAGHPSADADLVRRALDDWPESEALRKAAGAYEELRTDPDLRAVLASGDDPDVLLRLIGDADVAEFRSLFCRLRDADMTKAALVLTQVELPKIQTLRRDDLTPFIRASDQEVRYPAISAMPDAEGLGPEEAARRAANRSTPAPPDQRGQAL